MAPGNHSFKKEINSDREAIIPLDDLKDFDVVYADNKGRVVGEFGGLKNDKDKPDWSLLPLKTIEGIVDVLTYGARKYARDNWKSVSKERNFAAMMRHLAKWQDGEEFDIESGLHHLDHALCDLMFIKYSVMTHKEDRMEIKEDKETDEWKYGKGVV